jgi:hypothetical protein
MAGNGGKRPGAGRKPKKISTIVKKLPKDTAAMILSEINENRAWLDLLQSDDLRIRLESLKYLTDRRDGKARQGMDLTHDGTLRVVVDVVRPDRGNKD